MARKPIKSRKPTKPRPKFRGTKKQREALTRRRQSVKAREALQEYAKNIGVIEHRTKDGRLLLRHELTEKNVSEYNRKMYRRIVKQEWIEIGRAHV